jgi:hypothetical protein
MPGGFVANCLRFGFAILLKNQPDAALDPCIGPSYIGRDASRVFQVSEESGMGRVATVRLEETVRKRVQAWARANRGSFLDQVRYYVFLGMVVEENPDLPVAFIKDLLKAKEEAKGGLAVPYSGGTQE